MCHNVNTKQVLYQRITIISIIVNHEELEHLNKQWTTMCIELKIIQVQELLYLQEFIQLIVVK